MCRVAGQARVDIPRVRRSSPDALGAVQAAEFPGVQDVGEFALAVARPEAALELVHVCERDAAFGGEGMAHGGYVYDADAARVAEVERRRGVRW